MTEVTGVVYALRVQSVFPESHMIPDISPENGFPRQCMTRYLRFAYTLKGAGFPAPFSWTVFCLIQTETEKPRRKMPIPVIAHPPEV